LHLHTQLQTRAGPLPQRAVGIFAEDVHIATLATDAEGAAERTLSLAAEGSLGLGRHALTARFESDLPGLSSSHSQPVWIQIEPPPRPNGAWLIVPAAASVALAWWSARRSQQRKRTGARPAGLRGSEVQLGKTEHGSVPHQHTLSGTVADVDDGRALTATISLSSGVGYSASLQTTPAGRFDSGPLPAGKFRARVFAPGYEPAEFELTMPHPGTGSQMSIALRSLRVIALDTYDHALSPLMGRAHTRARTVRETLAAAVSGGLASADVEPLAQSVEHMAYSRAVPLESDLRDLQRRALTTQEEIAQHTPDSAIPGSNQSQA
jgi:hypothetical protein